MKNISKKRKKEILTAYGMLLPLMSGVLVFYLYAFLMNVYYSFTNKSSFGRPKFVGWQNYIKLWQDRLFVQAFGNTLLYVVICVPLIVLVSIALALLLNSRVRGIGIFRTLIFLPAVTLPAAIGLLWKWLMNYEFGILNELLRKLGLPPVAWLSDPRFVLYSVAFVFIWANVAYQVIVLLAGLQGIPAQYREADAIDGANRRQQFFGITLPLLSPSIFFVCVTSLISVFQIFDFIYLMIPQGSSGKNAASSLVTYFFEQSFVKFHKGYGAAVSMILFLLILGMTLLQMKLKDRFVFYDN